MPLTPEDVRQREFRLSFRGYNEEEVDSFLDEVEVELARLLKENADLRSQATAAPAPVSSEAEEMLRRTLLLAQRTADETVASAQAEAERMVEEARTQAAATLQHAQQQATTSVADLERRRQALEQHIEGLRAFEREYRTRLKAYLEAQLRDLDGRGQAATDAARPAAAGAPAGAPGAAPVSASSPAPAYDEDGDEVPRPEP